MAEPDIPVPSDPQHLAQLSSELAELMSTAEDLAAQEKASMDLVPLTSTSPAQAKAAMAELHNAVEHAREQVLGKQRALEAAMKSQMEKARAIMAPLEKMTERLREGIWSVNLYLGRDEEVVCLRGGDPAPFDAPIVVRQLVLAMDEESTLFAEDGGMDCENIEDFDAWLLADPAHLQQVFPHDKGVVALRPRGQDKRYDNPWESLAKQSENAWTYFLIRNGERLYRISTDFMVGRRLVPLASEFASFFQYESLERDANGLHRVKLPLKPGTSEWTRAEEQADGRRRHYMRVALILQGLVDRTEVFAPLPTQPFSFLDLDLYDDGKITIIADAEPALGTGAESFRDWHRRLNSELRVGMRIIGAFNTLEFSRELQDSAQYGERRVQPRNAEGPPANELLTIEEERPGGRFVMRYKRTQEVWDPNLREPVPDRPGYVYRGGFKVPKTRASCELYREDAFVLAYDLATVEEMERFLTSRTERHQYVNMFPLLKAAIALKKQEAALEAPFLQLLASQISQSNGVDIESAAQAVPELVRWWKFKNREHRPLVGNDESKALRQIVVEHRRRLEAAQEEIATADLEDLLGRYPNALLVAAKRSGDTVVLTPANADDIFVHEHTIARSGKTSSKTWVLPTNRIQSWKLHHTSPRWASWNLKVSKTDVLSDPEIATCVERVRVLESRRPQQAIAVTYDPSDRSFSRWVVGDPAKIGSGWDRPKPAQVDKFVYRWKRVGSRIEIEDTYRGNEYDWPDTHRKGHPWSNPLWEDPEQIAALDAQIPAYLEANDRYSRLIDLRDQYEKRISRAWVARAAEVERQRFIEDFGDESLWAKNKRRERHTFPYIISNRRWGDTKTEAFRELLVATVESGVDPTGHTVRATAALHGVPIEMLPEDILDLQF